MGLIREIGWRSQPQVPVGVAKSAISQGLVLLTPLGLLEESIDLVRGLRGTRTGLNTRRVSGLGSYPQFGSSDYLDLTLPGGISGTTPITIAFTYRQTAQTDAYPVALAWKPTGATNQFLITIGPTTAYNFAVGPRDGASSGSEFGPGTPPMNVDRAVLLTLSAGTDSGTRSTRRLWINGVAQPDLFATSFGVDSGAGFRLGKNYTLSNYFEGSIGNFHIWNRVLTDSEAREWTLNPFITRAPRRRVLWDAPAGGTNGTATGATLLAPRTLIAGTATGVRNATATGSTVLAPRTLIAGTASAGTNGTAAGAIVTAARTLIAGAATGAATAAGAIVTAARTLIAGTAAATSFAPGALVTAARTLIAGTATGVRNGTAPGAVLLAPRTLLAGAAYSDAGSGSPLWRFIGLHVGRIGL